MAENELEVRQPDAAAEEEDSFAAELAESIRANKALLTGLKYQLGQKLLQAEQGDGEPPSAVELAALKKLETGIRNDELFLEARALTRRRRPCT